MFCACGCGQTTSVWTRNDTHQGRVKGQHARFRSGHNANTFTGVTLEERMTARIDRQGDDECWPWLGSKTAKGYGHLVVNRKSVYGHRWSYENHVGPIPEGMEIDHLCRNQSCVNPAHLEPVTTAENLRRMREYLASQQGQQGA